MIRFKPVNFLMLALFVTCAMGIFVERSTTLEEYTLGEWLINYSGGFVRRGLSGSIILGFSDLLSLRPELVINCFLLMVFTCNLGLISILLFKMTAAQTFWLLFSPALFLMLPTETIARKENLFFLIFLTHAVLILSKKETWLSFYQQIVLPVMGILVALSHEIYVLFIPYHWLLFTYSIQSQSKLRKTTMLNLLPMIVFALAVIFPGSYGLQKSMCNELKDFAIACKGGIEAIGMPAQYSAAHSLEIIKDVYSIRVTRLVRPNTKTYALRLLECLPNIRLPIALKSSRMFIASGRTF